MFSLSATLVGHSSSCMPTALMCRHGILCPLVRICLRCDGNACPVDLLCMCLVRVEPFVALTSSAQFIPRHMAVTLNENTCFKKVTHHCSSLNWAQNSSHWIHDVLFTVYRAVDTCLLWGCDFHALPTIRTHTVERISCQVNQCPCDAGKYCHSGDVTFPMWCEDWGALAIQPFRHATLQ